MLLEILDILVCLIFVFIHVCSIQFCHFFPSKRRPVTFTIEPPPNTPSVVPITIVPSAPIQPITFHVGSHDLSSNHQRSGKYFKRKTFHRIVTTRRPVKVLRQTFPPELWAMIIGFLDCQSQGRFDLAIDIRKCLLLHFFTSPALEKLPLHLLPLQWIKTRHVRLSKLQSVLLRSDDEFPDDNEDDFIPSVRRSTLVALKFIDLSKLTTIDIYTDGNTPGLLSSIARSKPALQSCKFSHSSHLDQDYCSHDLGNIPADLF